MIEEAEDLHAKIRDIVDGHMHAVVLYALALVLFDALGSEYFVNRKLTVRQRIENLTGAIREILIRLSGETAH